MTTKEDLIDIFNTIAEEETDNGLKVDLIKEDDFFEYSFKKSHYIFINNVTIAFDTAKLDNDNLHFYIGDVAVSAIAILNVENVSN